MKRRVEADSFAEQFRELTAERLDRETIARRVGLTRAGVDMAVRRATLRGTDLTPRRIGADAVRTHLDVLTDRDDLACRDHDPELFFPVGRPGVPRQYDDDLDDRVTEAKQVCASCPARLLCLQVAVEGGYVGVWGATTDDERRHVKIERLA